MFTKRAIISLDPYRNMSHLNLATAYLNIEDYLSNKKSTITESEKLFLIQLMNRIRAIETAQKGWLAAELKLLNNTPDKKNQRKLLKDIASAEKKKIAFTQLTVKKLQDDISKELKKESLSESTIHLLNFVGQCSSAVLSNIQPKIKLPNPAKSYVVSVTQSKEEREFYSGNHSFFSYTNQLGGRSIPANQVNDPLIGKQREKDKEIDFQGACLGHVMRWRDEVQKYGKDTTSVSLNAVSMSYQAKQHFDKATTTLSYRSLTEIHQLVNHIISQMNDRKIYGLSIECYSWSQNHACGLRIIPKTHEVEFIDSNTNKVVVFPDIDHFAVWLKNYLISYKLRSIYYSDRAGGILALHDIGPQPSNATTSIPVNIKPKISPFDVSESKTFIDEQIINFDKEYKDHKNIIIVLGAFHRRFELQSHVVAQLNAQKSRQKLEQLNDQYMQFQLHRHEQAIGKHLDDKAKKAYYDSITQNHRTLKSKATDEIDRHIRKMGTSHPDIKVALIDLKKRINDAPIALSLSAIVDNWLLTKSKNNMTNRSMLQKHGKSFEFIGELVKNFEVSPIGLSIVQELLTHKILDIMKQPLPKGLPVDYRLLSESFLTSGDPKAILTSMRQVCRASYGNWFWRRWTNESEALHELKHALKDIDIENPHSLLKAFSDLQRINFVVGPTSAYKK